MSGVGTLRQGNVVASWSVVERVDMTFSINKSHLALCIGITVADCGFNSTQDRDIIWAQMLHPTSEWEGMLWCKPVWVDYNRDFSPRPGEAGDKGIEREMYPPGTH